MSSAPFEFTVREDNARSAYFVSSARFATHATWDDEATDDEPSAIVAIDLRGPFGAVRAHAASPSGPTLGATPTPPLRPNPWADDEVTDVTFALPAV